MDIIKKILVGQPEWNRLLRRTGRGSEDNIKIVLRGTGCEGLGWFQLTHYSLRWQT